MARDPASPESPALTSTWAAWKSFRHTFGALQGRVLLTLFYFIVVGPFAIGLKVLSDPLRLKPPGSGHWTDRPDLREGAARQARRQF
jgi:hypothetical protein